MQNVQARDSFFNPNDVLEKETTLAPLPWYPMGLGCASQAPSRCGGTALGHCGVHGGLAVGTALLRLVWQPGSGTLAKTGARQIPC